METFSSGSLKALNAITLTPLHLRSRACCFGFSLSQLKNSLSSLSISLSPSFQPRYPLCSLRENGSSLPQGAGEGVKEDTRKRLLQVVLVSPQIPGNTGCIARTCAASAVGLHLVGPLGFKVDDTKLKRAGLDYWPYVVVKIHSSWGEFREYLRQQEGEKRLLAFTKRGTQIHSEFTFRKGDYLVFGSETSGLPAEAISDCTKGIHGGGTIKIPMVETYVRCLNLSVSVGIALYEASRQLNYEHFHSVPETCTDGEFAFIAEDIFA